MPTLDAPPIQPLYAIPLISYPINVVLGWEVIYRGPPPPGAVIIEAVL
jgi:hypothetical protein